jgi:uncharacterized membrane protein
MIDRPKINLPIEGKDKLMEHYSWVTFIAIWVFAFYAYLKAPDIIPIHFGLDGKADRFGGKASLFIFPLIISFVMFIFTILLKRPDIHNYAVKVTEENAARLYAASNRMLRIVKCIINTFMLYFSFEFVQALKSEQLQFSMWSLIIFLVVLFSAIAFQIFRMNKLK